MALVAVKYLGDPTRNGMQTIEDWYLPDGAFPTSFFDEAGRKLYLIGTDKEIQAADRQLGRDPSVGYDGHDFSYVAKVVPVGPDVVDTVIVDTPASTEATKI